MNPVLTIDPEFEAKCPPLTGDELSQLEENILEEGLVLMPLIVWNDTIVDGHNRYRIAQEYMRQQKDEKAGIARMIELDYADPGAVRMFIEASGWLRQR